MQFYLFFLFVEDKLPEKNVTSSRLNYGCKIEFLFLHIYRYLRILTDFFSEEILNVSTQKSQFSFSRKSS